eukprot:Awhi_evm3s11054
MSFVGSGCARNLLSLQAALRWKLTDRKSEGTLLTGLNSSLFSSEFVMLTFDWRGGHYCLKFNVVRHLPGDLEVVIGHNFMINDLGIRIAFPDGDTVRNENQNEVWSIFSRVVERKPDEEMMLKSPWDGSEVK